MNLKQQIIESLKKGEGTAARALNNLPVFMLNKIPKILSYPYQYPKLDPFLKSLMALQYKQGYTGFISKDIQQARNQFERQMKVLATQPTYIKQVKDINVVIQKDVVKVRHYHPEPSKSLPMIVFYHGGGFVVGSVDTHDEVCRLLSINANVQVLSVEYPLAPESSPTDILYLCEGVLEWVFENRRIFNISTQGIAVSGDSAGGNIAAVIAQRAKEKAYAPQAQLLIYPVVDSKRHYPSKELYKEGLVLTGLDLKIATQHYIEQHQAQLDDPMISPIYGNLQNLAPTYIVTAGHDVLHDEGEAYVDALSQCGVPVKYVEYSDQTHGFVNFTFISQRAKQITIETAQSFRAFWDKHS